ncbi:MAG: serine/threonine protein kinase [Pirellulales bacterium]|nr:serine/threonine protein kinase [Pirellulales bacterium]
MDSASRYEIIDTIAKGDFATVYRARDRQLGREVAVKQIHEQFLSDPRQLERYWGEAQLLASLQHPNIVTIYDLVRPRGWIVLELMRGSLRRSPQSKPIDLDLLRMVLVCSLNALQFLHTNGVIHGDVKPSNMLVDMQNRVKLGDFGLARRASSEEGSLLKGTTKYMAPELMSADFGPVGLASDLYSLGFAAYELMCGAQFVDLFPGLTSYGRNEQVAWMMWHSAADRKLPEIGRVLQGVPDDLARVIQRLSLKDQKSRYKSASEALADLKADKVMIDAPPETVDPAELAAQAAAANKKRRRRWIAIAAVAWSVVISAVLLIPTPEPPKPPANKPVVGVLRDDYQEGRKLALELPDGSIKEVKLDGKVLVSINDRESLPRDLRPGDQVWAKTYRNESGQLITELRATRPELSIGQIASLKADEGTFVLEKAGAEAGQTLLVAVPPELAITFNGRPTHDGKPMKLADLQPGDRATVRHVAGKHEGREATSLAVQRLVSLDGVIRRIDTSKGELVIALGQEDDAPLDTWPLAPNCQVTLNGRRILGAKELLPSDLMPGDTAKIRHDAEVRFVDAYRVLGQRGRIARIRYGERTVEVTPTGGGRALPYAVGAKTTITLDGKAVSFDVLRQGDRVEITYDTPEGATPEALTIAATRASDPKRFAVLVATDRYDDQTVGPLGNAVADATLLRDQLVGRYRVPEDQALLLADVSRVRLEQGLASFIQRAGRADKLIVYVGGQAYRDADGKVYLAPTNFDRNRMAGTGLPLQWLVDRLETSPAKDKLLFLDCSHANPGGDASQQPSTAEMFKALNAPPNRGPFRSVTGVASCSPGQRGQVSADQKHGRFAAALAEGYSGAADKNRDNQLETTELFGYLTAAMAQAGADQTPRLVLPDDTPPRLSQEAKAAIQKLASDVRMDRINLTEVRRAYDAAARQAGDEPEPKLLLGLALTKARKWNDALRQWERIRTAHPNELLPLEGLAWLHTIHATGRYDSAARDLSDLVGRIPKPSKPGASLGASSLQILERSGQLREFLAVAAEDARRPSASLLDRIDAAVAALGAEATSAYAKGRQKTMAVSKEFDQKIQTASSQSEAIRLGLDRYRPEKYLTFPFDQAIDQILNGLDY